MTFNDLISSPCIRNCCLDNEDVCLGCFRSLPEIIGWTDADNAARLIILENTKSRRVTYIEKYKRISR